MTYVKTSVPKPGTNKGTGGDKKDLITLFDFDDVLTFPARDANGIVITGDIVMKPGAYMIQVYATKESIKLSQKPEGDTDAKGFMHTLEFSHPGSEDAIEEFLQNWTNRNIGAIVENCSTNKKRLAGLPCAGLQLSSDSIDDKDNNKTTITLAMTQKAAYRIANYQGTFTYSEVTDTVDADDTSIDLTAGEGRYQLTDGTAAVVVITTCTNAVVGGKYTLIGSGGTYPSTITKANDFLLANGTTWTALAGSEITFQAFKSDTAAWKFLELSRK